jgi:hypothetical protein
LEGLVLAVDGGAAGLLISRWMARLLIGWLPVRNPIFDQARPEARVMAFTLGHVESALHTIAHR